MGEDMRVVEPSSASSNTKPLADLEGASKPLNARGRKMAGVKQTITKRVPAKTSEKMEPKSPLKTTPDAGKGCRTSSKASSSSKGAPKRNFSRVLGAWLEEFNKTKGGRDSVLWGELENSG